jgi:hypothetical protein
MVAGFGLGLRDARLRAARRPRPAALVAIAGLQKLTREGPWAPEALRSPQLRLTV